MKYYRDKGGVPSGCEEYIRVHPDGKWDNWYYSVRQWRPSLSTEKIMYPFEDTRYFEELNPLFILIKLGAEVVK